MSIRAAMDNPEPVEPTMVSTPDGLYCLDHGVMDCTLPFCWKCGNHKMDSFDRCADPHCRATNDERARAAIERLKARYPFRPIPVEVLSDCIAEDWARAANHAITLPSLSPESGRGASGNGPASGAGS